MNLSHIMSSKLLCIVFSIILLLTSSQLLAQGQSHVHTVQEKETVYSISRKYKVSEEEIYRLNPGAEYGIRIGEQLKIPIPSKENHKADPSKKGTQEASPAKGIQHIVETGDTLYAIARRYGTTVPAILKLNPGLNADHIEAGKIIIIAQGNFKRETGSVKQNSEVHQNSVRIALLLPVDKNGPARYVHFYEGFLMGILNLKERGVSASIEVFHAEREQAIQQLIDEGKLKFANIIIGGHSESATKKLAQYVDKRDVIYVSPFVAQNSTDQYSPAVYQLNPAQRDLYPYLSLAFADKVYKRRVIFVEHPSGNHIPVIDALKKRLNQEKIAYKTCSFYDAKAGNWGFEDDGVETIVMLNDGRKEPTQIIIKSIEKKFGNSTHIHMFGYPEWQSYGIDFRKKVGSMGSTIYSSFYFDETQKECIDFARNYNKWYNRPNLEGYPKYAVLGYDVANYFVWAWALYASQIPQYFGGIPHDGLQSDFIFRKAEGENHFTNVGVFFINLNSDGSGTRHQVIF